jgi:hypothetical protein
MRLTAIFAVLMLSACLKSLETTPSGSSEALALLKAESFDELERTFSGVQRRYKIGAITDEDLRAAFRVFYSTDPSLEREYDLWVASHPRSYVAHLARGIYYKKIGLEQRGPQSFDRTNDEQLRAMKESFGKASADFNASYALDDKPLLTYMHAIKYQPVLWRSRRKPSTTQSGQCPRRWQRNRQSSIHGLPPRALGWQPG